MTSQSTPSVLHDFLIAALIASGTLYIWILVYTWFGEAANLDRGFVTFLGAILAISGLLFQQYMLKEVLDYLKLWDRMHDLLTIIIEISSTNEHAEKPHVKEFVQQKDQASTYSKYVRRELSIVPIVPLSLIFLYGCAFLADNSLVVRELCLFLMVLFVAYLAVTAVTSTRLACAYPDLEKAISDLEKLQRELVGYLG